MAHDADRATTRFLTPFLIDFVVSTGRLQGRHDLGLLFALVALSNVETVAQDVVLDRTYSCANVPDELRRPISANAIAQELNLPHETVRRQVNILAARGALTRIDQQGLIVTSAYLQAPEVFQVQNGIVESFLRVAVGLMDAGFEWPREIQSSDSANPDRERMPLFQVCRHLLGLGIRLAQLGITSHGRLENFLLAAAITEYNNRSITHDAYFARRFSRSRDRGPVDRLLEPAPISVLSVRTGLARATTNRMVRAMIATGRIERVGHGVVMPSRVFETPAARQQIAAFHKYFLATASRLATLGLGGDDLRQWSLKGIARTDETPPPPPVQIQLSLSPGRPQTPGV